MGAFTIGNSVSTRPKDSVNCHPSVLWGCTAWASCLQLLIEGSHDAVSWPRSCPVGHGTEQSREWQQASFHGRERAKVRGLQPAVWPRPLEFTMTAILAQYQICHWWKEISSVLALAKKGKDSELVHIRGLVWWRSLYLSCELERIASCPSISGVC